MQEGAPILHSELRTEGMDSSPDQETNIDSHIQRKLGDPQTGFDQAAITIEREFHTATVHHGYI